MQRVIDICERPDRAVPEVLVGFSDAFRASLSEAELTRVANRIPNSLSGIFGFLRSTARYENDPVCVDFMQSFAASMERLRESGIFGDCGAYTVAFSALSTRMGYGPGLWLLLGDAENPGQHIVNFFALVGNPSNGLVIDSTLANGFGLAIPAYFTSIRVIDPRSGQELTS